MNSSALRIRQKISRQCLTEIGSPNEVLKKRTTKKGEGGLLLAKRAGGKAGRKKGLLKGRPAVGEEVRKKENRGRVKNKAFLHKPKRK